MSDADSGGTLATQTLDTGEANAQNTPPDTGGKQAPAWLEEGYSDEEKTVLGRYSSPEAAAKAYVQLQKKLGSSVQIPGKDASKEDRAKFYARLGRPEASDGYVLDNLVGPGAVGVDAEAFKKTAHELNLTQDQARETYKWLHGRVAEGAAQRKAKSDEALQKAQSELRTEYGEKYDENLALMGRVIGKYGPPGLPKYLNESGEGNNPDLIRFMVAIGQATREDRMEAGRVRDRKVEGEVEPGVLNYPNSPGMTGENRFGK